MPLDGQKCLSTGTQADEMGTSRAGGSPPVHLCTLAAARMLFRSPHMALYGLLPRAPGVMSTKRVQHPRMLIKLTDRQGVEKACKPREKACIQ